MPAQAAMRKTIVANMVLVFIIAIAAYCVLPARIAAHMDAQFHIDRWGKRWELFVSPVLTGICQWLFFLFWQHLGKAEHVKSSAGTLALIRWSFITVCAIFSTIAAYTILLTSTRTLYDVNPPPLSLVLIFAFFFLLSAVLSRKGHSG